MQVYKGESTQWILSNCNTDRGAGPLHRGGARERGGVRRGVEEVPNHRQP